MQTAQDILNILIRDGKISEAKAQEIQVQVINSNQPLEELLIKKRIVSQVDFLRAKAESLNIPFVNLKEKALAPELAAYIPESVSRRYILTPFEFNSKKMELSVAMEDPLDFQVIEFLEKKSGKKILPAMAVKEDILTTIDATYSQTIGADVTAALKETGVDDVKTYEAGKLGEIIRDAPIAQIVSATLEQAMNLRASDVHIEPLGTNTRVRYRIDGILQERLSLPKKLHEAVVSRIKILADLKIDEKRIPQDGRFNYKMGGSEVDLRVSTLPTVHGEKIVMRLLKKSGGIPTLPELGLRGLALKHLENSILKPHGIILVTGPTGSGKTTSLYSVLSRLNNNRVNIVTLEDPVEYQIAGVNQVQINPAAGLTFSSGLKSFLRQDPNIILVGEIRDHETTDLAIQAALTGHLVFSTLHTNNASGAIPRLIDLGAEPFLVASALNAVVGQRITRRICPICRTELKVDAEVIADVKKVLEGLIPPDKEIILYKGTGIIEGKPCQNCGGTGYYSRMGVFEVFPVTESINKLILSRATNMEIERTAIKEGMVTMKQDGYLKVLEGITTLEEVLRVAQD